MADETHTTVLELEDKFSRALRGAGRSVDSFNRRLDRATKHVQYFQQGIARAGRSVVGFGMNAIRTFTRLLAIVGALTVALAALGGMMVFSLLKVAAEYESAQVSFEAMLGSAKAAREMMEFISKFAVETPFQLPEVIEAARLLSAFGLPARDWLKIVGDIAATFGATAENVEAIVMSLGRIKAADYGEAFQQLRRFGIGKEELMGAGVQYSAKTGQLVSGQKPEVMLAAIRAIGSARPYLDQMIKQMSTLQGAVSNLEDAFWRLKLTLGLRILPAFSATINQITTMLEKFTESPALEAIASWMENLFSYENLSKAIGRLLWFVALAVNLAQTIKMGWYDVQTYLDEGFMPAGWLRDLAVKMLKILSFVSMLASAWYLVAAAIYTARVAMGDITALGGMALSAALAGGLGAASVALGKEAKLLGEGREGAKFTLAEELVAAARKAYEFPGGAKLLYSHWMEELGLDKAIAATEEQTGATKDQTAATEEATKATDALTGIVRKIIGGGNIAGLGIAPVEIARWQQYRREEMAGGQSRIVIHFSQSAQNKMVEGVQDIVTDAVAQLMTGTFRSYSFARTGG